MRTLGANAQTFAPWLFLPGNVRELSNLIQRAVLFCAGTTLEAANFPADVQQAVLPSLQSHPAVPHTR